MALIDGVTLVDHRVHSDFRGDLVAFEEDGNLPFPLRRVFFMNVNALRVVRGGHANSCDELIISLRGAVSVEVDNGYQQCSVRLERYEQGLWIRAGIMIALRRFEPGTLLLVCASERYEDTRHFSRAMPDLLTAHTSA